MSAEAPTLDRPQVETSIPQAEVGPYAGLTEAEIAAKLLEDTSGPLNTELNHQIHHGLLSEDARKRVAPLQRSRDLARLSEEVRTHQDGTNAAELSEDAKLAIEHGETPGSILGSAIEFADQYKAVSAEAEDPLAYEHQLREARTSYIEAVTSRPGLRGRNERKAKIAEAESAYNEAFLTKISSLMEVDPNHRKAPYVPETMENLQMDPTDLEGLSQNQMHVLVDQLAREQVLKAKEIEKRSNVGAKKVLNALKNSRALRVAVGGAIWAGSLVAANKGMLPKNAEFVGDTFEHVMPMIAGYITSREVFAGAAEGVEKFNSSKQLKRDIQALSESTMLTNLALGTIYNGVEYQNGTIVGRRGGETSEDNKDAFRNVNDEFEQLEAEGSRGGKPYKAEQILPYVADLYLRRKDELDAIVKSGDPKEAFLKLCKEVIDEDTAKLTETHRANNAKKILFRGLSVASTALVGQWMSEIRTAQTMTARPESMVAKGMA